MYKFLLSLIIVGLLCVSSPAQEKQSSRSDILKSLKKLDDSKAVHKYNAYNRKYRKGVNFHNRVLRNVGYRPIITWIPEGVGMHVGPVIVSPDRKYVRLGINMNFSSIKGFSTFNMGSGKSTWYPSGK